MAQPLALISLQNKTHLVPHAIALLRLNYELVLTDGSYNHLHTALSVAENCPKISEQERSHWLGRIWRTEQLFGVSQLLDGLLKTLDPRIHAALIATPAQLNAAKEQPDAHPALERLSRLIDLVYVDLYAFEDATKNPNASYEEVMHSMDLGGVALLRTAAKGGRVSIPAPGYFPMLLGWLQEGMPMREIILPRIHGATMRHVSRYDELISKWLLEEAENENENDRHR